MAQLEVSEVVEETLDSRSLCFSLHCPLLIRSLEQRDDKKKKKSHTMTFRILIVHTIIAVMMVQRYVVYTGIAAKLTGELQYSNPVHYSVVIYVFDDLYQHYPIACTDTCTMYMYYTLPYSLVQVLARP